MPALTGPFLRPMHCPMVTLVPSLVPDRRFPPQSYPWRDHMTQSMIAPLDAEIKVKIVLPQKKAAKHSCMAVLVVNM